MTSLDNVQHSALDEPRENPSWVALHIFYASNNNPVLRECIAPLVADFRASGLIDRYFFIRYWEEGPHLRLRLRPARAQDRSLVLDRAQERVEAYIQARPSLYRLDPEVLDPVYRDMFLMEHTEKEWEARYGEEGAIPLRESNTVVEYPYEPEYVKYGGPAGLQIAEWHFEASSDLVLRLIATTNVHVRTIMFGLGLQLMAVTTSTFIPDRGRAVWFHEVYQAFWNSGFLSSSAFLFTTQDDHSEAYELMAGPLVERLSAIEEAVHAGDADQLPGFLGQWSRHCIVLREKVVRAASAGDLVFPDRDGAGGRAVVTDQDRVLEILLFPYIHMTSNRLGVGIAEESYLSHLLARYYADRMTEVDP